MVGLQGSDVHLSNAEEPCLVPKVGITGTALAA